MRIIITCLLCCWFGQQLMAQEPPSHTKGIVGINIGSADTNRIPIKLVSPARYKRSDHPLLFIDMKIVRWKKIKRLNADMVDHIDILKRKEAIAQYGEKGRYGVVFITTKKKSDPLPGKKKRSNK
jgi:hypothetical protein